MDAIMEVLEPVINAITGFIGEDFDISAIIDTVVGFISEIIGGIA